MLRVALLLLVLVTVAVACTRVSEFEKSNPRPWEDSQKVLWERTAEQVLKGLTDPDHLRLLAEDLRREPYRTYFLDAKGHFRQDRIPRLKLHRAKTLLDWSKEAALETWRRAGVDQPKPWEVLAAQRELADWYVGGLWVPGIGYIGEVWAPVYGLPYDPSGNAGGFTAWFHDFNPPLSSLPYEGVEELYWLRIHLEHNSILTPQKDQTGRVVGFLDVRTGRRYRIAEGEVSVSSRQDTAYFGADLGGNPLIFQGKRIHLVLEGG